jgi:hypothetical protein
MYEAVFSPQGDDNKVISKPGDDTLEVLVFCMTGIEDDLLDMMGSPGIEGFPAMYDEETFDGREVPAEERQGACAKIEIKNGYSYHYIKRGPNGRFFDPQGLYDRNSRTRRLGEDVWKYRQVPPKVMRLYLRYLKTKNKAHLHAAEREMI